MPAVVDEAKCTGCQSCVDVCPVSAIAMESDKAKVDEGTCVDCQACVSQCPVEAISMK